MSPAITVWRSALVMAGWAALALCPASADAAATCEKPSGLHVGYRDRAVTLLWDNVEPANTRWYICRRGLHRPRAWYQTQGYGDFTQGEKFARAGRRIGFAWQIEGEDHEEGYVGWLDTGTLKKRIIRNGTLEFEGVAVTPSGALAYLSGPGPADGVDGAYWPQEIRYAPPRGGLRVLVDLPEGGVAGRSLRLTRGGVSWRARSGEQRSVPVTARPRAWAFTSEFAIPTRSSKPVAITAGPDGALWFTEYAAGQIGRITTDGAITEFKIPTRQSRPDGIVAGPDGAIWFTEGAGKIGRITVDGQISEFTVPTADARPAQITVGPDGALWFTERLAKKIGRITIGGQINEFRTPAGTEQAVGIASGADGSIWFVADRGGRDSIVRVATDGSVTGEFQVGRRSGAVLLAPGPDGALWYTTAAAAPGIGRISTTGAIHEFGGALVAAGPGITAGPDGALWFTEQAGGVNDAARIGRMTTDGRFTRFRLPADSSAPFGITTGPDGALWFTEYGTGKIGRITTDALP
jgi:virginiamycin B lyase